MSRAFIVESDMLTPYGRGVQAAWDALMSGRDALGPVDERFSTKGMRAHNAALVSGIDYQDPALSAVMQMLTPLLSGLKGKLPKGTRLYLATTKGEIDLLERSVINGLSPNIALESNPRTLLKKLDEMLMPEVQSVFVSAACASSTTALAMAASDVSRGTVPSALVVACDSVNEFVYSGFSSLMAIDTDCAKPFDADRAGLSLGEAAAYALIVDEDKLISDYDNQQAVEIAGWGMTSDANHMTGPSRDGLGLARAIKTAIKLAGIETADIHSIAAHGTGTRYNDAMEMKAFRSLFDINHPLPVYSVKGGMGHTMGAAGLVETLLAGHSCFERTVPPTVGLNNIDPDAEGWAGTEAQSLETGKGDYALTTNSGFGGVNAALLVRPHAKVSQA